MEKNYGFLEGLAPLKRYLSVSLTGQTQAVPTLSQLRSASTSTVHEHQLQDDVFGSWGPDDYNDLSSPTLVNDYTASEMDLSADTPIVEQHVFSDWGVSPTKHTRVTRSALKLTVPTRFRRLRDVYALLMKKRELMGEECAAFLDEFKYVLVTSQLLDETILVSRFYKKKKSSNFDLQSTFRSGVVTDFGRVIKIRTRYAITAPINQHNVIRIASVLIYLKKHHNSHSRRQIQATLTVLLLTLWLHTRSRNVILSIIHTTLLNKLKSFITRYQKFDTMIQKLLNKFKEMKIYSNVLPQVQIPTSEVVSPNQVFNLVSSTIFLSSQGLLNGLHELIPLVNSTELENYCGIYNIELSELSSQLTDSMPPDCSADGLAHAVKRFQYLRRFSICCLLALSLEQSDSSEFMRTVCKIFDVTMDKACPIVIKWKKVSGVIEALQTLNAVLVESMNNFVTMNNLILGALPTHTELQKTPTYALPDPTADIRRKLKQLQVSLISFNRDRSAEDQASEFKEIGTIIESLNDSYQRDLLALESSTTQRQFHLSKRINSRSSKRFSLPTPQHHQMISPPRSTSSSSATASPVNHKRLSSGLPVSLLTVLEEGGSVEYAQRDYIVEHNLLSNDDSVVIASNTDDTFESMTNEDLKKQLERNFERLTSTSTTIEELEGDEKTELNKNDKMISEEDGAPLMDELRAALLKR